MTEQEFEKLWQENRAKLLANDEEYKRISKSYMAWGWLDYLVLIGGSVICETFVNSFALSTFVKFALEILGMFIIWLGFRLIKARLGSKNTLEDVEQRIKERYKSTLH